MQNQTIQPFLEYFKSIRGRALGIETPPLYGLTSGQVRERRKQDRKMKVFIAGATRRRIAGRS